jgi:hypothetical protein
MVSGKGFDAVIMLVMAACFFGVIILRRSGYKPSLRRLPGLEAFEEGVGRATELGRPVFFTTFQSEIEHASRGPSVLAGLSCMGYVARLCARYDTQLYTIFNAPQVQPLQDSILRAGYAAEGKADQYNPVEQMIYTPQWSYVLFTASFLQEKNIGCAFYIVQGPHTDQQRPSIGIKISAFQVVGATSAQVSWLVAACDYSIVGEEVYCAGAYLSKNEEMMGTIASQDWVKLIVIVLTIIGSIAAAAGSTAIIDMLGV